MHSFLNSAATYILLNFLQFRKTTIDIKNSTTLKKISTVLVFLININFVSLTDYLKE